MSQWPNVILAWLYHLEWLIAWTLLIFSNSRVQGISENEEIAATGTNTMQSDDESSFQMEDEDASLDSDDEEDVSDFYDSEDEEDEASRDWSVFE